MMKKLGGVLVMGHWLRLLVLLKGPKRVHKIPLEVNQQLSPSAYNGITGRAKTAIPVRIQLKDPNHSPSCSNILLNKRLKRDYNQLFKHF
jgi:hypothetical protein